MLETKTRQIGEYKYRCTQLGALKGRKVLVRLLKTVGPALDGVSEGSVGSLLGKLASSLDEDTVDYLCDTMAARTEVELPSGKSVDLAGIFELHFAGKYGEMVKWLAFAVEVNFSSFFSDLAKGVKPEADSSPPVE